MASGFDWSDAVAYAPLLDADRSLFAWEWLRRDRHYRFAAEEALARTVPARRQDPAAAPFGLVAFESPHLRVPDARPLWRSDIHPFVLPVARGRALATSDEFDLAQLEQLATVARGAGAEHLLLSDGLRAIRLDGAAGTFGNGPVCLRYLIEGIAAAECPVITLRRFLALWRTGRFGRSLHRREPQARRWILMLRAWDAKESGANQREIAQELLSGSVREPRWRSRESSVRSQAQRLVRSASMFANGGYRGLLSGRFATRVVDPGLASVSPG